jgi:glutamate transport system permease protein
VVFVVEQRSVILEGFWATLRLAALSGALSFVIGTALAVLRVCPIPPLRWAGALYVTLLRTTPLTLVFVFSTFGLPRLDIRLSFFAFAVVALTAYTSAFVCEAVRSGINSVAPSVGLSFGQVLGVVVLPQAMRAVIPPLSNVFIALTKNTSIAVAFSVAEATSILRRLQNQDASATFPLLITTAAGYLVLTLAISFVFSRLERRAAVAR